MSCNQGSHTHILESPEKSWIFQALESPGNESLRSWKVLENEDPEYLMNLLGFKINNV